MQRGREADECREGERQRQRNVERQGRVERMREREGVMNMNHINKRL
jgi:hypothetical protein